MKNSHCENLNRELDVNIPPCEPFNKTIIPLILFASLPPKKDDKPIEHKVNDILAYKVSNVFI